MHSFVYTKMYMLYTLKTTTPDVSEVSLTFSQKLIFKLTGFIVVLPISLKLCSKWILSLYSHFGCPNGFAFSFTLFMRLLLDSCFASYGLSERALGSEVIKMMLSKHVCVKIM